MAAPHPWQHHGLGRKGHWLLIVHVHVRMSREDAEFVNGSIVPNVSNRQLAPRQPCACSALHCVHGPRQTLFWVNASDCGRCGRSRSPAAKARRDTALKPESKWFCCVNLARILWCPLTLGSFDAGFASYSLATPPTVLHSIWPCHSFNPALLSSHTFFFLERAPSALAA
jgi:hypothetical protein